MIANHRIREGNGGEIIMQFSKPFTSTAMLLLAPLLCAQNEDIEQLDPLVVTASRAPMEQKQVIQSMTVITREDIERRRVTHIAALLADVPGLAVSHSGAVGSQTQVRVRGAESNHILVMIDGVEANDPASGDDFRFEHMQTADVERIEIVRGPQSALWGTDALAGVINIITRSGRGEADRSVFLEAGSDSMINGGLGLDFGGGEVFAHIGLSHFETDGTNISRTGDEDDGSETTTLNARFNARWSDRSVVDAMFRYVDAQSDIDAIDFFTTGLPTDADLGNDAKRSYARLRGTLDGQLAQTLTLTYLDTDNDNQVGGVVNSLSSARKLGLYYQADYSLAPGHRLTAALDYEEIDFSQRGQAFSFGDPNQDHQIDTLGWVAEYVGGDSRGWDWTASVRRDNHSDFDDANSYRAALAYAFNDRSRLRASTGTGRKAPTFTERFGFFADVFIGNPDLEPENSKSYELAYEYTAPNGSFALILFDQDLEDEINGFVFDPAQGVFTAENETGTSERSGVELTAQWRLDEGWDIGGSYTYTDATEHSFERQTDELRRPRHMGHLFFNYQGFDGRANINLNLNYNGIQDDIFFPPFPEPSSIVELDDYLLIDLAGSWSLNRKIELYGRIRNLSDESYENVFGFATPGRTVMAGIRYRFGQ
jgi:vitamin B12 transporter